MIEPRADRPRAITLGTYKAYDAENFVDELRMMHVTPHVEQNTSGRNSATDAHDAARRLPYEPAHPQAPRGDPLDKAIGGRRRPVSEAFQPATKRA